jgi:hypothetical protein
MLTASGEPIRKIATPKPSEISDAPRTRATTERTERRR